MNKILSSGLTDDEFITQMMHHTISHERDAKFNVKPQITTISGILKSVIILIIRRPRNH